MAVNDPGLAIPVHSLRMIFFVSVVQHDKCRNLLSFTVAVILMFSQYNSIAQNFSDFKFCIIKASSLLTSIGLSTFFSIN